MKILKFYLLDPNLDKNLIGPSTRTNLKKFMGPDKEIPQHIFYL